MRWGVKGLEVDGVSQWVGKLLGCGVLMSVVRNEAASELMN